jgi:sodium-dependent phosphate cotransporter
MGANLGTTITAVIAALYKTEAAISVAIVHVLFNLIGSLIFLPFPKLREYPVRLAKSFGRKTAKNKTIGFAYILLTFFVIPFFLIYFNQSEVEQKPLQGTIEKREEVVFIEDFCPSRLPL